MDPALLAEVLLTGPAEAILVSDREGAIVFWNPGAERVFGFSAAEAMGQSLDLIIPEPQRERHWTGYDQTLATGVSKYAAGDLLSVPALTKDGRRISVKFTISLIPGEDGLPAALAAVARDVTAAFDERRELRRRIAALEKPA